MSQFSGESSATVILAESVAPVANVVIANQNRLGPYSTFLKDAFETSVGTQFLQVLDGGSVAQTTAQDTPIDIVALGRSLSPEEKAQGFAQQLITREKIAFIVSPENAFQGSLTVQQLADILSGTITNWQELGGDDLPIRLVNRAASSDVRLALAKYGVFDEAQWDLNALPPETDTTSEVMAQLGADGISYAPANETLEQVSAQILSVDNVGVDDGRYPFSLPLYYVYRTPIREDVQGFLEFVQTPDAQSAIEFAQSQPADPARSFPQPVIKELQVSTVGDAGALTKSDPVPTIALDSSAQSAAPTASPSNTLPLILAFLILAVLGWLAMMRVRMEKRQRRTPRPAPDYAQRLKSQGSNRNPEELDAIATKFKEKSDAERAERQAKLEQPNIPDLALDGDRLKTGETPQAAPSANELPSQEADVPVEEASALELTETPPIVSDEASSGNDESGAPIWDESSGSVEALEPFWEEDMTTLQVPSELSVDDDVTVIQAAPKSHEQLDEFPDDDLTILQGTVEQAASEPLSPEDVSQNIDEARRSEDREPRNRDDRSIPDPWDDPA